MSLLGTLLTTLLPKVWDTVDATLQDTDKANELKANIHKALLDYDTKELESAASIITAEAKGESWLQRNWRPVTMLTFLGIIVMFWFGFSPPNATEAIITKIFDIVQWGLSGYVVGRSAEKVAKVWKAN